MARKIRLIMDEVITAFGRIGAWFGSDLFDVAPDIITIAKGLTSGYVPTGAALMRKEPADASWAARAASCSTA